MGGPLVEIELAGSGSDSLVAKLRGEIDASNARELRIELANHLPATASRVVLDLDAVTYLDSTGIRMLFEFAELVAARRRTLRLAVSADHRLRRALELCNINQVAPISGTVGEALAAGGGPTADRTDPAS